MTRQQSETTGRRETDRERKERKQREAAERAEEGVSCERTKAHRLGRCENPDCSEAPKPKRIRKPRRKKEAVS